MTTLADAGQAKMKKKPTRQFRDVQRSILIVERYLNSTKVERKSFCECEKKKEETSKMTKREV